MTEPEWANLIAVLALGISLFSIALQWFNWRPRLKVSAQLVDQGRFSHQTAEGEAVNKTGTSVIVSVVNPTSHTATIEGLAIQTGGKTIDMGVYFSSKGKPWGATSTTVDPHSRIEETLWVCGEKSIEAAGVRRGTRIRIVAIDLMGKHYKSSQIRLPNDPK